MTAIARTRLARKNNVEAPRGRAVHNVGNIGAVLNGNGGGDADDNDRLGVELQTMQRLRDARRECERYSAAVAFTIKTFSSRSISAPKSTASARG